MRGIEFKLALLAMLLLQVLFSCEDDVSKTPELTDISIKTPPSKVDYYVGDVLDLTGLVVTLHMDNGKTKDVNFADFSNKGIFCYPENGEELSIESDVVKIMDAVTKKSAEQIISTEYYSCIEGYLKTSAHTVQRTTESEVVYDEESVTHRGYVFKPLKDITIKEIGGMIAKTGAYKVEMFKFEDTGWDNMTIDETLLIDTITVDNTESFIYKGLNTDIYLQANQRYLIRYFNQDHSSVYDVGMGYGSGDYISFPLQINDIEIELPYYSYANIIDNEIWLSSYGTFDQGILRGLPDFKYKLN